MSRRGLGELLRHLQELTDGSMDQYYTGLPFEYRARYTPVIRALGDGVATVNQLKEQLSVTQGAVSQTLKLMVADELIDVEKGVDGRQRVIRLTSQGQRAFKALSPVWSSIFNAIEELEGEIGLPLLKTLQHTVSALEQKSFADRVVSTASSDGPPQNFFIDNNQNYAKFRPVYPDALVKALAEIAQSRSVALDVGCGNGQLTQLLAAHFEMVVGTDPSEGQISQIKPVENIRYLVEPAEQISLPDESVDLIVAAQAAHWFDLSKFYLEAKRLAKPEAIIALVSYGVPYIDDAINSIFQQGYWQQTHQYWPAERRHVETCYADISFPFTQIDVPAQKISAQLNLEQLIGYIQTWSAFSKARSAGKLHDFTQFFDNLMTHWGDPRQVKTVVWPIAVKAAKVHAES